MKLCRFKISSACHHARIGLTTDDTTVLDLSAAGVKSLTALLEGDNLAAVLQALMTLPMPRLPLAEVTLLAPVEQQEVWAAGVTYLRSKKARMDESEFSASAYDRVYDAERPEIFFKSLPEKVVATRSDVGIRRDAKWNVPEPELALVCNSRGKVVGYTIGNDMSSRDIEGENLLYLPQAKTYLKSCALGPFIRVGATEAEARAWAITIEIQRGAAVVFNGETSVGQIKRTFDSLAEFLFRSQSFPHGAVLLTGTGVVPPDNFTLAAGDRVRIRISGIGTLENPVAVV